MDLAFAPELEAFRAEVAAWLESQLAGPFKALRGLNNHVDPDLFDIFVRRKVYRRYAEMFLDPEQIDAVDESKIPGYRP